MFNVTELAEGRGFLVRVKGSGALPMFLWGSCKKNNNNNNHVVKDDAHGICTRRKITGLTLHYVFMIWNTNVSKACFATGNQFYASRPVLCRRRLWRNMVIICSVNKYMRSCMKVLSSKSGHDSRGGVATCLLWRVLVTLALANLTVEVASLRPPTDGQERVPTRRGETAFYRYIPYKPQWDWTCQGKYGH